jgi:hypothetical protein
MCEFARMKQIMVALALGLVAACGSGDKLDGHIAKLEGYRDKMCKCTTLECAEALKQEVSAWEKGLEKELKATYESRSDVPKSFMEKWDVAEKPMKKCYRDLADKAPAPATP